MEEPHFTLCLVLGTRVVGRPCEEGRMERLARKGGELALEDPLVGVWHQCGWHVEARRGWRWAWVPFKAREALRGNWRFSVAWRWRSWQGLEARCVGAGARGVTVLRVLPQTSRGVTALGSRCPSATALRTRPRSRGTLLPEVPRELDAVARGTTALWSRPRKARGSRVLR
jgi:hypothetical protein